MATPSATKSPSVPASRAGGEQWRENRPSRGWRRLDLGELWSYRGLAYFLALKDVQLRYKQTLLGVGWAVLQPFGAALLFSIFLGRLANVPSDDIAYAVFVYAGLTIWWYFSNGVGAAANSLVESRGLVTNVYFPRVLAPLAAVLPGLIDLALSLVILAVFMIVYGVVPTAALVLLPLWIVAAVLTTFAVGVWLAALNALYRDVRYALGFLLQVALFVSPVVFPSSLVPDSWRWVYALNPMVGVLDGFRWSAIGGPAPPWADAMSLVAGSVLLIGGLAYFLRTERRLGDRI